MKRNRRGAENRLEQQVVSAVGKRTPTPTGRRLKQNIRKLLRIVDLRHQTEKRKVVILKPSQESGPIEDKANEKEKGPIDRWWERSGVQDLNLSQPANLTDRICDRSELNSRTSCLEGNRRSACLQRTTAHRTVARDLDDTMHSADALSSTGCRGRQCGRDPSYFARRGGRFGEVPIVLRYGLKQGGSKMRVARTVRQT